MGAVSTTAALLPAAAHAAAASPDALAAQPSPLVGSRQPAVVPSRVVAAAAAGGGPAWKIQHENQGKWVNPLIGWTSTADPLENVARQLYFTSQEEAIAFAGALPRMPAAAAGCASEPTRCTARTQPQDALQSLFWAALMRQCPLHAAAAVPQLNRRLHPSSGRGVLKSVRCQLLTCCTLVFRPSRREERVGVRGTGVPQPQQGAAQALCRLRRQVSRAWRQLKQRRSVCAFRQGMTDNPPLHPPPFLLAASL